MSPALLTARLKSFEEQGLAVRRKITGQRGFEYYPTEACEKLMPVLIAMGEWGLCWARLFTSDEETTGACALADRDVEGRIPRIFRLSDHSIEVLESEHSVFFRRR